MYNIELGKTGLIVPTLAVGCMRINGLTKLEAERFINSAIEQGAYFFDHADIYGRGECESLFAESYGMTAEKREKILLQSKCGIVPGKMFDFSKEHIIASVEGSLKRLKTDYLDVLLLHRPDALMEPEEIAEAFTALKRSGKVRHFGVSNQSPGQVELISRYLDMPIAANQLQLSITNCTMIKAGLNVNMKIDPAVNRDGGVLDYCRLNGITIQPWSPFQYGFFEGTFIDCEKFKPLNDCLEKIANKYGADKTAVVIAWLLRHPARFQPVTGTMNEGRLKSCIRGTEIKLTREEWYEIYLSAGNKLP